MSDALRPLCEGTVNRSTYVIRDGASRKARRLLPPFIHGAPLPRYLVVKGMEILQIALASNREKRDGIITIGVLMLITCIVAAGGFVMRQDQQATSVSCTTGAPSR